jgi:hypothetical protein
LTASGSEMPFVASVSSADTARLNTGRSWLGAVCPIFRRLFAALRTAPAACAAVVGSDIEPSVCCRSRMAADRDKAWQKAGLVGAARSLVVVDASVLLGAEQAVASSVAITETIISASLNDLKEARPREGRARYRLISPTDILTVSTFRCTAWPPIGASPPGSGAVVLALPPKTEFGNYRTFLRELCRLPLLQRPRTNSAPTRASALAAPPRPSVRHQHR